MTTTAVPVPSSAELIVLTETIAVVASDVDELVRRIKSREALADGEIGRLLLAAHELHGAGSIVQSLAIELRELVLEKGLESNGRAAMPSDEALADWLKNRSLQRYEGGEA